MTRLSWLVSRFRNQLSGSFQLGAPLAFGGLLACLAAACPAQAQGATTTATGALTSLYAFSALSKSSSAPFNAPSLTLGKDGYFYGTRSVAGSDNDGTIFRLTPSTGAVKQLYSFTNGKDGEYPFGILLPDASTSGLYYGVTANTVFSFNTSNNKVTPLHAFTAATDGTLPPGGLAYGPDGYLYGTTSKGGPFSGGTVFKISPSTGAFTVLYAFTASNSTAASNAVGYYPNSPLALGKDGNLYGTTSNGGYEPNPQSPPYGTVFQITPTGTLSTIHSFTGGSDGAQFDDSYETPMGALLLASNGSFYGVAGTGGGANDEGVVYNITTGGTVTPLYTFAPTSSDSNGDPTSFDDGGFPVAGLVFGSDGALYGSTEYGGANETGTLFRVPTSGGYSDLHDFAAATTSDPTNADGDYPESSLALYSSGVFYGATGFGGTPGKSSGYSAGTLFKLQVTVTSSPTPTTEARFDFNKDGHADLFWYNTGTGGVSVWDMNDQTVLNYGATFATVAPSSGWLPVATPDVNNDGYPDLLWWNSKSGEMLFWTLQNTTVLNYGGTFATVSDTDWKPVAAADVTGTTWELVFQNTATGDISRWTMNGQSVVSYGGTLASLGANSPYQIVGAPDLDGDGYSDLLFWNSSTGGVSYWSTNLSAGTVLSTHSDFTSLTDTSWHLVGSEDTNGDGHSDLLWWNATTGEVSRWLLNGTTVTQYGGDTAKVPDTTWSPTAIR